jgi:hypothetical protein
MRNLPRLTGTWKRDLEWIIVVQGPRRSRYADQSREGVATAYIRELICESSLIDALNCFPYFSPVPLLLRAQVS